MVKRKVKVKRKPKKKDVSKVDEVLEELAIKLKSIRDEKSLSEEDETKEENIQNLELDHFTPMQFLDEGKTPVLERIAGSQPRPIFVGGISQTPATVPGEEEKSDEFKYVPRQEGNNEPKYITSDSEMLLEPTQVDMRKIGREQSQFDSRANQEAFFMNSESHLQIKSPTHERKREVEQIDTKRAGRENPYECSSSCQRCQKC